MDARAERDVRERAGRWRVLLVVLVGGALVLGAAVWLALARRSRRTEEWYEAVQAALFAGNMSPLESLLQNGMDPNATNTPSDKSLMLMAVYYGKPQMLRLLLAHGGDAAKEEPAGWPLVNQAVVQGAPVEVIRLLVENGAQVNALDKEGGTPLARAGLNGDVEAARVLLELGVAPNAPSMDGQTALHLAALEGHPDVAEVLLSAGADPNVRNECGRTPLDYALSRPEPSCSQVAEILRRHGGVEGPPTGAEVR